MCVCVSAHNKLSNFFSENDLFFPYLGWQVFSLGKLKILFHFPVAFVVFVSLNVVPLMVIIFFSLSSIFQWPSLLDNFSVM